MIVRYLMLFQRYIVNFPADPRQVLRSSAALVNSRCNIVIFAVIIAAPVPVEEMFASRHSFSGLKLDGVDRKSSR
jgi:hypothetical protein